jgi:hypothetical protein
MSQEKELRPPLVASYRRILKRAWRLVRELRAERITLLEEVRQLNAAVRIYQEIAWRMETTQSQNGRANAGSEYFCEVPRPNPSPAAISSMATPFHCSKRI